MRNPAPLAVFVIVVALAGCSSSSPKASPNATTTTATGSPIAPNTPAQIAADKTLARAALVRLTDLPAGYKSSPSSDSTGDNIPPAVLDKFATCAGVSSAEAASVLNDHHDKSQPSVQSDFELHGGAVQEVDLENDIEIDRSAADIAKPFSVLGAKNSLGCWKDLFQAAMAQQAPTAASFGGVTVVALPIAGLGRQAVAFQAHLGVSSSGFTVPLSLDFYFVGHGRAGISLFASWIDRPADNAMERALLNKVIGRLRTVA